MIDKWMPSDWSSNDEERGYMVNDILKYMKSTGEKDLATVAKALGYDD